MAEYRGLDKVVDRPRANRALVRQPAGRSEACQENLGVFGGPQSNLRLSGSGRRHTATEFSRTSSRTSIFGSDEAPVAPRPSGRRHCGTPEARSRSPIAAPATDAAAEGPAKPAGRKHGFRVRADAVLTAENFRPLQPGERPNVFCVSDSECPRPHSARHGRAHTDSANRRSVLFAADGNVPATCAAADKEVAARYDGRFTRTPSDMQRFQPTPSNCRRTGLNEQQVSPNRTGKAVRREPSLSLDGVLRPESKPKPVDASYRVKAPWR